MEDRKYEFKITPEEWLKKNRPSTHNKVDFEWKKRGDFTDAEFASLDDWAKFIVGVNTDYKLHPRTLRKPNVRYYFCPSFLKDLFDYAPLDKVPHTMRVELLYSSIVEASDWDVKSGDTYVLKIIKDEPVRCVVTGVAYTYRIDFIFGGFVYYYQWDYGDWGWRNTITQYKKRTPVIKKKKVT